MERTEIRTIAAASTAVFVIGDEAQFMVKKSITGANLNAGSIAAVHAGSTGEEPVYFPSSFYLSKLHLEPGLVREVRWVFIATPVLCLHPSFVGRGRYIFIVLVPLLASYLTATAGCAPCCVI